MVEATYDRLKQELAQITDLARALGLIEWDQQTMMPPRGASARAEQMATLAGLIHERGTSPAIGHMLEELRPFESDHAPESIEASLIRVTRREYEKQRRVPAELQIEMSRASGLAFPAWMEARETSNFASFAPHLERMLELKKQYIACFGGFDCDYDALLDDFEPGTTTAEVSAVFARLRDALTPLVARIRERQDRVDGSPFIGNFPKERQRALLLDLLPHLGYEPDAMRLDEAPHPFAESAAITDVRLTTRFDERNLGSALFGTIHEQGHGLYEAGFSLDLDRTPLARAASLGLHESQSRLWENIVARSHPFWTFATTLLRKHFPEQFGNVSEEALFRAANQMKPSLIRVEADETTYALHIILRFEIEQDLINGNLAVADLPEAWNSKMRDYLGVEVPNDTQGVLQDIHWADGYLGYFPTYALGSVISAQIWQRVKTELPDIEQSFAKGEFLGLREWLRENLHQHGRKFTAKETVELVAGGPLDPEPFIVYVTGKIDELYGR
jgi:carboxypeptidase Taq